MSSLKLISKCFGFSEQLKYRQIITVAFLKAFLVLFDYQRIQEGSSYSKTTSIFRTQMITKYDTKLNNNIYIVAFHVYSNILTVDHDDIVKYLSIELR